MIRKIIQQMNQILFFQVRTFVLKVNVDITFLPSAQPRYFFVRFAQSIFWKLLCSKIGTVFLSSVFAFISFAKKGISCGSF